MRSIYLYSLLLFCPMLAAQGNSLDSAIAKAKEYQAKMVDGYSREDHQAHKKFADSLLLLAQTSGLKELEVMALMNQGIYYTNTYKYGDAVEKYLKAKNASEKLDNEKPRVSVMANLANLYNIMEDYPKAIEASKEVIQIAGKYEGTEKILMASYNALSISNRHLNKPEESLEYVFRVKEIAEKIKDSLNMLTALNNIGDNYIHLKKFTEAIKVSEQSLELNKKIGLEKAKSLSYLNIGLAHLRMGNIDTAILHLNACLQIAKVQHLTEREMHCQKLLAEAYEKKEALKKSLEAQKRYQVLKDTQSTEKKRAIKLESDIKTKESTEAIANLQESITNINATKNSTVLTITAVALLLGMLLFVFIRKKQKLNKEAQQLRQDFTRLSGHHLILKKQLVELAEEKSAKPTEARYQNSSLTQGQREEYMQRILEYMDDKKPYLNASLNPSTMANELQIGQHHLSEVLNVSFGKNFYNFINIYRVNEAQKLLKNPKYQSIKIEAIGYEAGFNSKTSFNRVFKALVGKTPSDFRSQQA